MPPDRKQSFGDEIKTEFAKLKCDLLTWKDDIAKECYAMLMKQPLLNGTYSEFLLLLSAQ